MPDNIVMFPGFPLTLAAAHLVLRNWTLSELVVSAVAGCFATVSLSRLAGNRRAVLYLLTMPAAIFLMVGYAECCSWRSRSPRGTPRPRAGGGVPRSWPGWPGWCAWTRFPGPGAGRDGTDRPARAGRADAGPARTGAGGSCLGAPCLAAPGECRQVLLRLRRAGRLRDLPEGVHRQLASLGQRDQAGWFLHTVTPVQALKATYWVAFQHVFFAGVAFEYQLEIAVEAVIVLAALAFLCWRRWPEAVYCGLPALVIGTQTFPVRPANPAAPVPALRRPRRL